MRFLGTPRVSGTWTLLRGLLFAGWVAVVGWGMVRLTDYSFAPGQTGNPRDRWPVTTSLERAPGMLTLVMALHPECPCSRATVEQLDAVIARSQGRLRIIALFAGSGENGRDSELGRRVSRLPHTRIVEDADGHETRRFDFRTSGETRLYWLDGVLCFSGGITPARGHVGASAGSEFIVTAARSQERPDRVATPAFGCALFTDDVEPVQP